MISIIPCIMSEKIAKIRLLEASLGTFRSGLNPFLSNALSSVEQHDPQFVEQLGMLPITRWYSLCAKLSGRSLTWSPLLLGLCTIKRAS